MHPWLAKRTWCDKELGGHLSRLCSSAMMLFHKLNDEVTSLTHTKPQLWLHHQLISIFKALSTHTAVSPAGLVCL